MNIKLDFQNLGRQLIKELLDTGLNFRHIADCCNTSCIKLITFYNKLSKLSDHTLNCILRFWVYLLGSSATVLHNKEI